MTSHQLLQTPVGPLHLAATSTGLSHAVWLTRDHGRPPGDGSVAAAQILNRATAQLDEYFESARHEFDLPLDLSGGTVLQQAVWRALADIPEGTTIAYSELADRVGHPRAVRAVGTAVGANPVSIVLPCHRIIGTDGRLHGYAGGLDAKSWLLTHEGVDLPSVRK